MSIDSKPTNPKDMVGQTKLDLSIVPATLMISAAMAFLEGALKYGRFNWRMAGVRASVYIAALKRHLAKWENGQDYDKKTRVHHLDNAIACLTILRDAELYGKLEDDRAPCPDPDAMADLIDGSVETIAHLKAMFADHTPYQYTIRDTPHTPELTHLDELQRALDAFGPTPHTIIYHTDQRPGPGSTSPIKEEIAPHANGYTIGPRRWLPEEGRWSK